MGQENWVLDFYLLWKS